MSTEVAAPRHGGPLSGGVVEAWLERGRVVARVRVARSVWARFLGLMGRAQLDREEGLWLVPCRSIHMFFMRAPIDVAFLDRDGVVVRAVATMRPWSLRPVSVTLWPVRGAHSALELAPGTLERAGIQAGVRIHFRPPGERLPETVGAGSRHGAPVAAAGE